MQICFYFQRLKHDFDYIQMPFNLWLFQVGGGALFCFVVLCRIFSPDRLKNLNAAENDFGLLILWPPPPECCAVTIGLWDTMSGSCHNNAGEI